MSKLVAIHTERPIAGAAGFHYVEVVERGASWVRLRNPHLKGKDDQCQRMRRSEFDRALVEMEGE